mgnify:CR=1 FL=1
MKNILIINGPNLNLLGEREQSQYGSITFDSLKDICLKKSEDLGIKLDFLQSNIEGEIVSIIQDARNKHDGIITIEIPRELLDAKTKNGSDADFLVTYSEHDYNGQYGTWAMDYEEERLDKVRILTFLLEELATKDGSYEQRVITIGGTHFLGKLIEGVELKQESEPKPDLIMNEESEPVTQLTGSQEDANFHLHKAKVFHSSMWVHDINLASYHIDQAYRIDPSDKEIIKVAQSFFKKAKMDNKISTIIENAEKTLKSLIEVNSIFDLVFIDADKANYTTYFDFAINLVKRNGLIIFDNVLWHGDVAKKNVTDDQTELIRKFNMYIKNDKKTEKTILPIGDGLTICRKL